MHRQVTLCSRQSLHDTVMASQRASMATLTMQQPRSSFTQQCSACRRRSPARSLAKISPSRLQYMQCSGSHDPDVHTLLRLSSSCSYMQFLKLMRPRHGPRLILAVAVQQSALQLHHPRCDWQPAQGTQSSGEGQPGPTGNVPSSSTAA